MILNMRHGGTIVNDIRHGRAIYCGRHSSLSAGQKEIAAENWGSPVVVKQVCPVCNERHNTGVQTLPCYREWLWSNIKAKNPGYLLTDLASLTVGNPDLVCWCAPDPCHCGVLLRASAWAHKQLQRETGSILGFDSEWAFLSNDYRVHDMIFPDMEDHHSQTRYGKNFKSVTHAYLAWQYGLDAYTDKDGDNLYPGKLREVLRGLPTCYSTAEEKIEFMEELIRQKFERGNYHLARRLLLTGKRHIINASTARDQFWGVTPEGLGSNHLGKILMKQRDKMSA